MDRFLSGCQPFLAGGGHIEQTTGGARLTLPPASSTRYSDAQFDDYTGLRRRDYPHRPPLRLSLRARFSASKPLGTAGFGFWNNPFGAQSKVPALPQAIWFFYASPPSNMALAINVAGSGWKAACIDASRPSALAWAPISPAAMLLCRSPKLYRAIWSRAQRSLGIRERSLDGDMTEWHTFEIEWRRDRARWWVDGEVVLETDRSPRGPLGFVAWMDNQYSVVTPQGRFGFGLLDAPVEQWLEVAEVIIDSSGHLSELAAHHARPLRR